MTVSTKPNRSSPSLPGVGATLSSHSNLLVEIRHAIEIHERRTGQPLDSFVRLRELIELGIIEVKGDTVLLSISARDISYDNTASGLAATNLQDAIDEIAALISL